MSQSTTGRSGPRAPGRVWQRGWTALRHSNAARGRLRAILDEVRVSHEDAHLEELIRIVRRDRHNDHTVRLLGRVFLVRHIEALLRERHPEALHRNVGPMEEVLARFLHVSPDAIMKYRQRHRSSKITRMDYSLADDESRRQMHKLGFTAARTDSGVGVEPAAVTEEAPPADARKT